MTLNSKVTIQVEIKNIKKVADLKKELKDLRKEQKEAEKQAKTGQFTSKKAEKQYIASAKAIRVKSKSLRDLNKSLNGTNNATKGAVKSNNSMSKSFLKASAAIAVVVGAFRLVGRAISSVVSTFTEFEFMMAKVHAVSGATNDEFKDLTATAEELGRTTFFTATQVGELMLNFSKLGFTAQEIQSAVQPTLDLATATGSDLARSATVAGAAIRGFNLDASETGRVVDVMAVTFANSAMDIEKWQTSMTKVAPIANAAGFSIEDTAAMMSKLTDAGIEASIAGTSLRNILLKMQDPTSELSIAFGSTIHSLDDLVPAMEDFVLQGGSMADVMEVVDIRQAAAFETMLMSADTLVDFRDKLNDATGEGSRMAGMVGETLQGSFLKLKSAIQGVSIGAMKGYSNALQKNINKLANWLNRLVQSEEKIDQLLTRIKWVIKAIAGFVIGLKILRPLMRAWAIEASTTSVAVTAVRGAVIALSVGLRTLKIAIASTGIGLLVIALGELAANFGFAGSEEDKLASITDDYGRSIVGIIDLQRTIDSIEKGGLKRDASKISMINKLIDRYGDQETSLKDQEKILKKLNKLSPEFFKSLDTGSTSYDNLKKSAELYKEELLQIAKLNIAITASAENDAELLNLTSKIAAQEKLFSNADAYNEKVKRDLKNRLTIKDGGTFLRKSVKFFEAASEKLTNVGGGGLQGGAREARTEELNKLKAYRQELVEARLVEKELTKRIKEIDVSFFIGDNALGDFDDKGGEDVVSWTKTLTDEHNKIKQLQVDGTLNKEEAAIKMIEANMKVNRSEAESLSKQQANGAKGSALLGKYLDDSLKLAELKIKQGIDVAKNGYEVKHLALMKSFQDGIITIKEFNDKELLLKKDLLDAELLLIDKADVDYIEKVLKNRTAHADLEITIMKNATNDKEKLLVDAFNSEKLALELERATTMMSKVEFDNKMLTLEALFLDKKAKLYAGNALELIDINNDILANTVKVNENQKQLMQDQISAMGGVGSALSSLAGDNEKLNGIKEAGNKISQVANILSTAMALHENLITLGIIKQTAAKAANIAVDAAGLPIKATGAILNQGEGDPYTSFFRIIAMVALISKVMGMWEKGGIIDDGKFAKGGMVHGASHANGGVKFRVGGRVNELEGGEAVINKRSTAMFKDQLSSMNQAGGGVKFADGGLLNNPTFAQQQFSMSGGAGDSQKVYVVESDISKSQNSVNVLEAAATL